MATSSARTRKVVVVDNSHVARRVGERIRQARARLHLTQAQLAEGRYTAAYISALERGLAKPSMAALTFLSERLGVSIPDLVAEERPAAGRLEADLLLASGKPQEALDRYDALLETAGEDRRNRAELLRGRAEALCRLTLGTRRSAGIRSGGLSTRWRHPPMPPGRATGLPAPTTRRTTRPRPAASSRSCWQPTAPAWTWPPTSDSGS